eukprot:15664998-Heterocapsa_arctica.AAC.1
MRVQTSCDNHTACSTTQLSLSNLRPLPPSRQSYFHIARGGDRVHKSKLSLLGFDLGCASACSRHESRHPNIPSYPRNVFTQLLADA